MIWSMRRIPLDPAHLVSALLATAIGLQVAWMVTGAFGARDTGISASDALPEAMSPFEIIKGARLFGTAEQASADVSTAIPVSTQGLVLVGVLASTNAQDGRAIIGESGGSARVYTIGAILPGGSRLAEVYPDRVMLDRGGSLETLLLPRQGGTPGPLVPAAGSDAAGPSAVPSSLRGSTGDDLANAIRWQAVMRSDKPSGVRVYPGSDAQRFTNLGLQAGDLILAINDAPLADQANGEQFLRTLAGAPQARLTIERNGRTETLAVDLTALEKPMGITPNAANR
jgi:general secretion pathway protein C